MKRQVIRALACLLCAVLLCACAPEPDNKPIQTAPVGEPEGLPLSQRVRVTCFADTEYGYYYLDYAQDDILYRLSDSGDALAPLCQRPGCDHTDGSCDAWYPREHVLSNIGCFRGKLWLAADREDHAVVFRVDPQTGQREKAFVLPEAEYSVPPDFFYYDVYIHENRLIAVLNAAYEDLRSAPEDGYLQHAFVLELETGKITEPFAEFLSQRLSKDETVRFWQGACAEGDWLIVEGVRMIEDAQGKPCLQDCMLRANIKTGEVEKLLGGEDDVQPIAYRCKDGRLYCLDNGGDFWEVELSTGKAETIPCPVEGASVNGRYFSDDLIVVTMYPDLYTPFEDREEGFNPWDRIEYSFFSGQYELLDTLSVTNGLDFEFSTKDRLYFRNPDRPELFYLNRAAIGSGDLELTPMETEENT